MNLARFGHHPDPAIDFCIEVECIEGIAYDVSAGMTAQGILTDRLTRALDFAVGGDLLAIEAKATLRQIAARLQ